MGLGRALSAVVSVPAPSVFPFPALQVRLWRVNGLFNRETWELSEQSLERDSALCFTELHLSYLLHILLKGNPKWGPSTICVVTLLQEIFMKQFDLALTSVLASDSFPLSWKFMLLQPDIHGSCLRDDPNMGVFQLAMMLVTTRPQSAPRAKNSSEISDVWFSTKLSCLEDILECWQCW